jgi:diguanylate cyclase (GGDEF)-like protein
MDSTDSPISSACKPINALGQRAASLFSRGQRKLAKRYDRLFARLLLVEWMLAVGVALTVTPFTYAGTRSSIHLHVYAAVFLGGLIASVPVLLARWSSGTAATRHTIAAAQMLMSALMIDMTGGRIETHFMIFGSLAFLSFYSDWRVLLTASLVVVADHILRGAVIPQTIYGVPNVTPLRWLEHSIYVLFEDVVLFFKCVFALRDARATALRQAELEMTQAELLKTQGELEQRVQDRTRELSQSNQALVHQASHDILTGLPNRALFHERIQNALRQMHADSSYRVAILFLDLDRFKVINDSLGHRAGDALLVAVANRLERCLAESSAARDRLVARMGGDEFTVMLGGTANASEAERVAQRILQTVCQPVSFDGQELTVTASVGIVEPTPGHLAKAADLIRDADAAMYRAKGLGKNRVAKFDTALHEAAVRRLRLETDLRRARERGELQLHYQPIVNLSDRKLLGFEALIRWKRDGRLVSPADFIPIAEDTGLINDIGTWVLNEAAQQLAQWQREQPLLTMSVNLSNRQLADPHLVATVRETLQTWSIPPASIVLEVTESVIMSDPETARQVLAELKQTGVKLSMDDFGTGYSSLSCLHEFPIDVLKIDRSFVGDLSGKRHAAAVVHAIIQLAHNLRMTVVAEGLENPEQVAFLQALDCDSGQGFLFARPLPAADAGKLISHMDLEFLAAA